MTIKVNNGLHKNAKVKLKNGESLLLKKVDEVCFIANEGYVTIKSIDGEILLVAKSEVSSISIEKGNI